MPGPGASTTMKPWTPGGTVSPASSTIRVLTPGSGRAAQPGLKAVSVGAGREDGGARLGLPPGVDHGCGARAHVVPEPAPGLGVDGLADRAQQADGGEVVAGRDAVREPAHEGPDQGGRGVVLRDAVALDDLEVPAGVRGVRGALVDHLGGAVGQRPVQLVRVGRDPGEVRRAPVDVPVAQRGVRVAEEVFETPGRLREVPAGGVHQALGLAGGAGGVHDEQRRLGVERFRVVDVGGLPDDVVPPHVAARPSSERVRCSGAGSGAPRARARSRRRPDDGGVGALSLTGTAVPRRNWPSVVTRSLAPVSSTRKRSASAEKPPKTSEWMAPIRAHGQGDDHGLRR